MQKSIMDYVTESFNRTELIKEIIYFDKMRKLNISNVFRDAFETNMKQYLREYGNKDIIAIVVRMFDARKMCSNENLEIPVWDTRFSYYQYIKFKFRGFDHVCAILPFLYFTIFFDFDPQNKFIQDVQLEHKECYRYGEACNNCLERIAKTSFRHSETLKAIENPEYIPSSVYIPEENGIEIPIFQQDREIRPKIEKYFEDCHIVFRDFLRRFNTLMKDGDSYKLVEFEQEFPITIGFKEERNVKIPYFSIRIKTNIKIRNKKHRADPFITENYYYYCGKFTYEKP